LVNQGCSRLIIYPRCGNNAVKLKFGTYKNRATNVSMNAGGILTYKNLATDASMNAGRISNHTTNARMNAYAESKNRRKFTWGSWQVEC
jgi:spore coat protein U-like protein